MAKPPREKDVFTLTQDKAITSRLFARPSTGRIAVKVINHFGDVVLKVFEV